jgi:chromosomal replication initiation ATPase DnaA
MSDKKEVEQLLKNIQEGLKKYTVKELNEAIVSFLNNKDDKSPEIDYVLMLVSQDFGVPVKTLKRKNVRGTIQEAKQIAYCLMHFNLGLSIRYISKRVFFNWPTSVQTGIKKYKQADPNHPQDKQFIDKYNELQAQLIEKIAQTT